jgi:hypothetical protein
MATTKKAKVSSTVGINDTKGIKKIKSALNTYRTTITKKCKIEINNSQIEKAIKGKGSEATCKTLIKAINEEITKFIADLNKWDALLDTMANSYRSNDTSNTSFSDVTKKVNSGEFE